MNARVVVVGIGGDGWAGLDETRRRAVLGAEVVELHTGHYAEGRPGGLERLRAGASLLARLGLECHAGHGLTYANVGPVAAVPEVVELNIGHFLIGQAVLDGLPSAVARMKALIRGARP